MGMVPILGIDQSFTSTGYCVVDDNTLIDFGIIKSLKTSDIYDRAIQITDQLISLANKHTVSETRIEGLAFGMRGSATRDLAGLLFTIVTTFKRNGFDNIKIVSPKTIKKTATNSGKATKKQMIETLPDFVKFKFTEQGFKTTTGLADLADSYWISVCNI